MQSSTPFEVNVGRRCKTGKTRETWKTWETLEDTGDAKCYCSRFEGRRGANLLLDVGPDKHGLIPELLLLRSDGGGRIWIRWECERRAYREYGAEASSGGERGRGEAQSELRSGSQSKTGRGKRPRLTGGDRVCCI